MIKHINCLLLLCLVAFAETEFSPKLLSLFKEIQSKEEFQTVFVLRPFNKASDNQNGEDFIRDVSRTLHIPVIVSTEETSFSLKKEYNENILTIVTLDSKKLVLPILPDYLQHMRLGKTIFLLNNHTIDEFELKELFQFCWKNHMINVLAILENFQDSPMFYRYTRLPVYAIERVDWIADQRTTSYFPNRLRDLKGMYLPILIGGTEPAMIFSKNEQGQYFLRGFVGHFWNTFAKKHNARLNYSNTNLEIDHFEMGNLVLNGTFEISAMTIINVYYSKDWISYPITVGDWCIMLPVEPTVPVFKVYGIVFQLDALLITIGLVVVISVLLELATILCDGKKFSFFNDNCLRGILAQPLVQRRNASFSLKVLYSLSFFFGIMLVTSFDAFLQTLMTSPPSEKRIKSVDDILASGLKVLAYKIENDKFFIKRPDLKKKYENIFLVEEDYTKFNQLRDSLDTKFAYMSNSIKWTIFQSQQKLLKRPLFRFPDEMCLMKRSQYGFPVNENSIFKEIINSLILEAHASGLLEFWQKRSFYELIENGKMTLPDQEHQTQLEPLKVTDLKWVLKALAIALAVDTLVFLGETYFYWRKTRKQ